MVREKNWNSTVTGWVSDVGDVVQTPKGGCHLAPSRSFLVASSILSALPTLSLRQRWFVDQASKHSWNYDYTLNYLPGKFKQKRGGGRNFRYATTAVLGCDVDIVDVGVQQGHDSG